MNDYDDLLFGVDDLERWKNGEQPEDWLVKQKDLLLQRSHDQTAQFRELLMSGDPVMARRLRERL